MLFGKPVIGCDGEGIGEVIEDGIHGFLVQKKNVESLAEAILKIFSDKSLTHAMGKRAKELADRELNYSAISKKLMQIYQTTML